MQFFFGRKDGFIASSFSGLLVVGEKEIHDHSLQSSGVSRHTLSSPCVGPWDEEYIRTDLGLVTQKF